MKYTVKVTGEAALGLPEQDFELDAASGDDAVNAVRAQLSALLPKEGGDLDVVVSCMEAWEKVSPTPRGGPLRETVPPGVVSGFSFHVQPHPDVRVKTEARHADSELAKLEGDERTKERVRLLFGLFNQGAIDQAQLASACADGTRSLESVVEQAMAGKAVSK